MKHIIAGTLLLLSIISSGQDRPKLVVTIVIDQCKAEYLNRFEPYFGKKGFNRFLKKGYRFNNVNYNFAPTYTGPGHASLFTGATPSIHGIIENGWYDPHKKRVVYCVEDSSALPVGTSNQDFMRSPDNLQSTTLSDEIKWAQGSNQSYAISIKDRSAVLSGGHTADGVYWYDSESGDFGTSTFYEATLPLWLQAFNSKDLPQYYLNQLWELSADSSDYAKWGSDDSPYEKALVPGAPPVFPYDLKGTTQLSALKTTPYGNQIIIDLAVDLMEAQNLGAGESMDYLALNFSATDYVGHGFGPRSWEVMDTYIKLDGQLEELFSFLDKKVGKGKYLVALSSDHGTAENNGFMNDQNWEGTSVDMISIESSLRDFSKQKWDTEIIEKVYPDRLYLDHRTMDSLGVSYQEATAEFKAVLYDMTFIHSVYDQQNLPYLSDQDFVGGKIKAGCQDSRAGDLIWVLKPGFMVYGSKGTTHGSVWNYDTHVPVLFYGWNIPEGQSFVSYPITSMASTLSLLLRVGMPSGAQSKPMLEVLPK